MKRGKEKNFLFRFQKFEDEWVKIHWLTKLIITSESLIALKLDLDKTSPSIITGLDLFSIKFAVSSSR